MFSTQKFGGYLSRLRKKRYNVFEKILAGEMDWHMIRILVPYAEYLSSPVEAAVVEGALPCRYSGKGKRQADM